MKSADKIIESLDGLKRAEAPAFFYTRLLGRMQHTSSSAQKKYYLAVRPVFIVSILLLALLINVATLIHFKDSGDRRSANTATIESFTNEYDFSARSIYQ
ncbi:hypothetical protein LK994_12355 [Ferruginibacter lapsinanis]|uniref:hypothetical protein n=1 Tax=Ferruginibacter lapsinanis TaxID=563172 RepID=UPI001E377785|nr:hypothetical protein [Ferruginibacter lapsinanis]UEG49424.1 hypothetical protein LK994_12355 [Ferruginibacter lapsinanis]